MSRQKANKIRTAEQQKQPEILNVAQVARLLGVCPRTVRNWVKANYIPHFKLPGGRIGFRCSRVNEWIDESCPRPQDRSA